MLVFLAIWFWANHAFNALVTSPSENGHIELPPRTLRGLVRGGSSWRTWHRAGAHEALALLNFLLLHPTSIYHLRSPLEIVIPPETPVCFVLSLPTCLRVGQAALSAVIGRAVCVSVPMFVPCLTYVNQMFSECLHVCKWKSYCFSA